jgi:uncharacterized protein YndB with AHSA1/START domain
MHHDVAAEPIVREVVIRAERETVFSFFTEADKLTRWLASEATLDARPGGACVQVHAPGDGRGPFHMHGTFVEVDPPERLVFTWGFTDPGVGVPPGSTTVEVTFLPDQDGTRLTLVHRGLPPSAYEGHAEGWMEMLERLAAAIVDTTEEAT